MTSNYNPYQVICIGSDCELYDECDNECILKDSFKKYIKGCHYSKTNQCSYCSHRKKCILIKPYSEKINKIEIKRNGLENENKLLRGYIKEWDKIENELDKYGKNSVTDVVYFKRSKQQMIDRINDNNKLIEAYRRKENDLLN